MVLSIGVVGAGISGLVTSYRLREELRSRGIDFDLTLYEKNARAGGSIFSERRDGFLIEWGPNGFLNNEAASFQLINDLGIRDRLVVSDDSARKRFLLINGRLNQVPTGPRGFLTTPILPWWAKIRFGLEPFVWKKCKEADETVADFVSRRFGKAAVNRMFDPLISGVYAGDVNKLSIHNTFKVFSEMEQEYGTVVRGMFKRLKQRKQEDQNTEGKIDPLLTASKNPMAGKLLSFKEGMGELTATLEKSLKNELVTQVEINEVEKTAKGFSMEINAEGRGKELRNHDFLILAAPPTATASMIDSIKPDLAEELTKIKSSTIATIALGFDGSALDNELNGFGYLIPRNEKIRSLGVLWSSSIFADRASAGDKLLTVMIGGAHDMDAINLDDSQLIDIALKDAQPYLQITGQPKMTNVIRHRLGIPQYVLGHKERVNLIEEQNRKDDGLYFAGNGYFGISANDCIRNSGKLAETIAAHADNK